MTHQHTYQGIEAMLEISLAWLANLKARDESLYLETMPNNVPGVAVLRQRLASIRQVRGQRMCPCGCFFTRAPQDPTHCEGCQVVDRLAAPETQEVSP